MGIIAKIKMLFTVKKSVNQIKEAYMEEKTWTSRKFLLTVVGALASFWGAAQGFLPQELSIKIGAGLIAVFVIMNALTRIALIAVKFTKTTKDDEAVAALTEALAELQKRVSPPSSTTNVTVNEKPA